MPTYPRLLVASLLLLGCHGNSPTEPVELRLSFDTVLKSPYSGYTQPRREVIRTPGEWDLAWQTLHSGATPRPILPAIDFRREMVVLAAAGTRPSGCYQIDVTRADYRRSGIELEVTESVPGPSCVCTLAITQPVHVVRMERFSDSESFAERTHTMQC